MLEQIKNGLFFRTFIYKKQLKTFNKMKEIIAQLVYPSPFVLLGLFLLILLDALTGINKAGRAGELTTSRGLRNSISKASCYLNLLLSVTILLNLLNLADSKDEYTNIFYLSNNGLALACVYIETKSIFENLIEINTNQKTRVQNDLCNFILVPLHNLLILKLNSRKENINI